MAQRCSAAPETHARVRVEPDKPFSYNFSAGNYVICRHHDVPHPVFPGVQRSGGAQYIFAAPGARGWTSDGTDVIAEGARLRDGTLEFDEFKEADLGQYSRPLQYEPNPSIGLT
ncbi:hypothetical protein AAVH_31966, partial [Aphelenchoides avenae]